MTDTTRKVALAAAAVLAAAGAAAAASAATVQAQPRQPADSNVHNVTALPDSLPNKWTEPEV
jgi:hypothetical protein